MSATIAEIYTGSEQCVNDDSSRRDWSWLGATHNATVQKQLLPHDATQSAVLLRQVVCLSVSPSVGPPVTLRYRDHIGWIRRKEFHD